MLEVRHEITYSDEVPKIFNTIISSPIECVCAFFTYQCKNLDRVIEIPLSSSGEACNNVELAKECKLEESSTKKTRNMPLLVQFQLINTVESISLRSTNIENYLELKISQ